MRQERMMLTSTVIKLRATQNGWLHSATGEYVHAAFLSLIEEVAPDLSKALHNAGKRQPYTVSPLLGARQERRGTSIRVSDGYWIRFTILDPALYEIFSRYFAEQVSFDYVFRLGNVPFLIEEVTSSLQPDGWSGYATFSQLLSSATPDPIIRMRFFSLTAFSIGDLANGGPRFVIFPQPELVFDSLLRRWNQFAGQSLSNPKESQTWIGEHVIVRQYHTESDLWWFADHPQVGFLGDCTYEVKGSYPAETRILNALADFAFFAGIGSRTSMGMGQTRRISTERGNRK